MRDTFTGLSRVSRAIATRDESIQHLLHHADSVTKLLAERRGDLVTLMKQGDLVFKELIARRDAIHSLLVNATKLAVNLRGVATDNQAQIKDALKQLDTALTFLRGRETAARRGAEEPRSVRLDPDQRHRHRPLVRRLRPQRRRLRRVQVGEEAELPMSRAHQVLRPTGHRDAGGGRLRRLHRQAARRRTVTAYFSRAVSIYKGSEVRVMGVKIGTVTAVVPEGNDVRVSMEYDPQYKLPAGAKAAIVTPTLTADRFVQIAPAYTGGPLMQDGARIALAETGTPVELDRISQALSDLTQALGPNGANKDGSLNTLLTAGAKALRGNGQLGNQTINNLSQAVQTFGDNSGPLFDSVQQHVAADHHAGGQRPLRRRLHGRPDLGLDRAGRRPRRAVRGPGRARPGRGHGAHLRARQQGRGRERRAPAQPTSSASWPSARTS